MTSASVAKMCMICTGNSRPSTVNSADAPRAKRRLRAKICRMRSMSRLPQYWAMSTAAPLASPKPVTLRMMNSWPPRLAAAMAVSPSWPSMTMSIMFTPRLMTFWMAMGRVMASTRR